MLKKLVTVICVVTCCMAADGVGVRKKEKTTRTGEEITSNVLTVLWRDPVDLASRNLYYGRGGEEHQPHGPFTFIDEDLDGSNVKFNVRDRDGVKWKVKLGAEAKPETAATRLVWAVGYFANEDYFLPTLHVENMPRHLKRKHADRFIGEGGTMPNARLKREAKDEKKVGNWRWKDDPFSSTRELNGLRVMMALINNWDLKDSNNGVYDEKLPRQRQERIYMVSDLGGTFGTAWLQKGHEKTRGNLASYWHTRFITKVHDDLVDFEDPRHPALIVLVNPHEFFSRMGLRWIGRNIPIEDVQWIDGYLAKLSHEQIRDAFRAAGFSNQEVEGFASVVESRIADLGTL